MVKRSRKTTDIRRREIAGAALQLVGEHGPRALTTARIAERVGVTSGALFRHFPTVEAMLDEAVDQGIEALESTFPDPALPPSQRLRTIASARVNLLSRRPGIAWLLLSDQVHLLVSEASVGRLRALVQRSRSFLLEALRQGIADGSIRDDQPPEALLVVFTGTVHALIGSRGVHRDPDRPNPTLDTLFALLAPPLSQR